VVTRNINTPVPDTFMSHAERVLVMSASAALLCGCTLASPPEQAANSCSAQALMLEKPAFMIVDAVVRGDRLLLPDSSSGLREIDLRTGQDLRLVLPMGTQPGEVSGPEHLGCGSGRCVVFGNRKFWVYYDSSWRFLHEYPGSTSSPIGQPLVLEDRIVVFGMAMSAAAASGYAYLYVRYDDGEILPLQDFPESMALPEIIKEIRFLGIVTGGLAATPDGGWVFVDPRSYSVHIFDNRDRLKGTWRGANPSFHAPNWAASPEVHDHSLEQFSRWQLAQPLVKRPVVLGEDLVAFAVGLPDGPLRQRHELDLYRLSGEPVALGLKIPGVWAGRLIAADADAGRIVLVGQETWAPLATTTVWQVEVPSVEKPK
jgi:hypothetical protein